MLDYREGHEHGDDDEIREWLASHGELRDVRRMVVHPAAGVVTVWRNGQSDEEGENVPMAGPIPDGLHERFDGQAAYLLGEPMDDERATT